MIREALRSWRAAFEDWLRHRTDETQAKEVSARNFYILLTT